MKVIRKLFMEACNKPVCPLSSRDTLTVPSLVFKLYIEQILSRPPHATKLPDGA